MDENNRDPVHPHSLPTAAALTPAVPISESVQLDFIICLEDGRPLKMMKSYLRKSFGLTPEQYRAKWRLPPNYPMVAPRYALKAATPGLREARLRRATAEAPKSTGEVVDLFPGPGKR